MDRRISTAAAVAAAALTTGLGFNMGAAHRRGFHFDKDNPPSPAPQGQGQTPAPAADPFQAMRDEFSTLQTESQNVLTAARTGNRALTDAERQANDTRFTRMQTIKQHLDDHNKFASLAIAAPQSNNVQLPATPPGREAFQASEQHRAGAPAAKMDRDTFSKHLNEWARNGHAGDKQFATITTATSSGAMLPRNIAAPIVPTTVNTLREALALYNQKPVETGTTADLKLPVMDAAPGAAVAQDASAETESAPSLSETITLNVATYESKSAWFSNQQLLAVDFDLLTFITQDLTYAKDLGLEAAAIAAIIADAGITQVVTTATTTGFTYENLVDLNNKLPKRYQRMKVILLSATAYAAAEKLVGDDGHPVLNKDPQNQSLMRFNGTPVLRCDYLEALTANKVVGVVFSLVAFKLRDVTTEELHRYDRVPARPAQTGFNLFGWHGWGYAVSAVAKLKTPAS